LKPFSGIFSTNHEPLTFSTGIMEMNICPKTPACPIFNGILKGTEYTEVYRRLYCEAGEEGRKRCRRFQVAAISGKCPPGVLPNATKTAEEIVAEMKKAGLA
jgi:hypothetical protein